MSNVAIATIVLPIIAKLSINPNINQNPLLLMIPATISCSFAFMVFIFY
jgi:di/tricarboxylate transporter